MTFPPLDLGPCRVVPFADRHLTERYVGWLNDPAVVRYSEQRHRRHTLGECTAYAASFAGSPHLFLAIEAADAALGHVGNLTVTVDLPNRTADVSIMVGEESARGTGIGTAAWCGVIDWLLGAGGLRRVTAGTMAVNAPMLALIAKSGMAVEAIRPRAFLLGGQEIAAVLAARFADAAAAKADRSERDDP